MSKIVVNKPIVDINGDEMARVLWNKIKKELIFPFIDLNLLTFDLSIENRDRTNDEITIESAKSIKINKVGVKCATITQTIKGLKEFNLKKKYPSPNGTIRNILNGTIFREPIIVKKIPKIVGHWNQPVVVARHAFGDIYKSKEVFTRNGGKLKFLYEHKDGIKEEIDIYDFQSDGVGLAYFNTFESIKDFAYSCFNFSVKEIFRYFFQLKTQFYKSMMNRLRKYLILYTKKNLKKNLKKKILFTSID